MNKLRSIYATFLERLGWCDDPPSTHVEEAMIAVHENRLARAELVRAFSDDDLFVRTLMEAHPRHE